MQKVQLQFQMVWEKDPSRNVSLAEDISLPDHCDDESLGFNVGNFAKIIFYLLIQAICKGVNYGSSWQKRGELRSVAANFDRKYDRLDTSFKDMEKHGHNDPQGRTDGASDLAVYSILYLSTYIYEHYIDAYNQWWNNEVMGFLKRFQNGNHIESKEEVSSSKPS